MNHNGGSETGCKLSVHSVTGTPHYLETIRSVMHLYCTNYQFWRIEHSQLAFFWSQSSIHKNTDLTSNVFGFDTKITLHTANPPIPPSLWQTIFAFRWAIDWQTLSFVVTSFLESFSNSFTIWLNSSPHGVHYITIKR